MKTSTSLSVLLAICITTSLFDLAACVERAAGDTFGTGVNNFNLEFVGVGNPGNAADSTGAPNPAGSVAAKFRIGKYETSRDMINKANVEGSLGITMGDLSLSGGNGPNKPASGISWFDAAVFVNWLNISTGSAAAYKFDGSTFELWRPGDAGYNPANPYRNCQARYFLPSVDEWYKAAYYDAANGIYYTFATGSDTPPISVAGGMLAGTAVYLRTFGSGPADVTLAGGLSPYGTMGQNGNVYEWQETGTGATTRGNRGGSWYDGAPNSTNNLSSSLWDSFAASSRINIIGFRVASVPEPSTLPVGIVVAGMFVVVGRRRAERGRALGREPQGIRGTSDALRPSFVPAFARAVRLIALALTALLNPITGAVNAAAPRTVALSGAGPRHVKRRKFPRLRLCAPGA